MATTAAPKVCNRRSSPCLWNRQSATYVGTADRGSRDSLNHAHYKRPRALKDPHFLFSDLHSPLSNPVTGPAAPAPRTAEALPTPPATHTPHHRPHAQAWFWDSVPSHGGDSKIHDGYLLLESASFSRCIGFSLSVYM